MNMKNEKSLFGKGQRAGPSPCKRLRLSLWQAPLDLNSGWVQRHVSQCARCQRRFQRLGRVELALQLAKTQIHSPELMARANRQAFKVLQRGVRETSQAETLKTIRPAPGWWQQMHQLRHGLSQMAACIALLLLGKIGLFGSIQGAQSRTEDAVRTYYSQRLGQSLADEVFPG